MHARRMNIARRFLHGILSRTHHFFGWFSRCTEDRRQSRHVQCFTKMKLIIPTTRSPAITDPNSTNAAKSRVSWHGTPSKSVPVPGSFSSFPLNSAGIFSTHFNTASVCPFGSTSTLVNSCVAVPVNSSFQCCWFYPRNMSVIVWGSTRLGRLTSYLFGTCELLCVLVVDK